MKKLSSNCNNTRAQAVEQHWNIMIHHTSWFSSHMYMYSYDQTFLFVVSPTRILPLPVCRTKSTRCTGSRRRWGTPYRRERPQPNPPIAHDHPIALSRFPTFSACSGTMRCTRALHDEPGKPCWQMESAELGGSDGQDIAGHNARAR